MKKAGIIIWIVLLCALLALTIRWYDNQNIKNYKIVADYIFSRLDKNDLAVSWYTYNSLLSECKDNAEVYGILKKHPNQFITIYIMCNDEVAFKRKGVYFMGNGGIAIVRNNKKPVENGEKIGLRGVIYKRRGDGVYRWTTGFFLF